MKRMKLSGAAFRKRKKIREASSKSNEGALLKFVTRNEEEIIAEVESVVSSTEGQAARADLPLAIVHSDEPHQSDGSHETTKKQNLKDVGQWPSIIDHNTRALLIQKGSKVVQNLDCEFKEVQRSTEKSKGQTRKLTVNWFFRTHQNGEKTLRTWLVYSPSKEALFCFCCKLFQTGNRSSFGSDEGFKSWWKLNPKIYEHESCSTHAKTFLQWKELEIRLTQGKTIDKIEHEIIVNEAKKWRQILTRFLHIIKFLAGQNLALRGYRENIHDDHNIENKGNFLELVHLISKYDPVLREHLVRVKAGDKYLTSYLSPKIQNEFITILGDQVRNRVIKQIKQSKYFCIIFDSTPDISHKDQMSQIIRYVRMDSGKDVKVEESFLRFIEMKGKNAEQIAALILETLEKDGIPIEDCRGQAFDNAAVMAGHRTGVQMRIKETNPKAVFTPCSNHSLNLAGVRAASVAVDSVTFFGALDRLFSFFSSSTHRWDILKQISGQSIKRVVETRWSSRADAVDVVRNKFHEIVSALERLMEDCENPTTRSDAGLILDALQTFPFLSFLGLWKIVLPELNDAQKYLQTKGLDLQQCNIKILSLKTNLIRNRDEIVGEAVTYSKEMCRNLGIVMERRVRRKKRMPGEECRDAHLTYEEEIRREMIEIIDTLIKELGTRYQEMHHLCKKYEFITPSHLLNEEYECNLGGVEEEEDINKEEFLIERRRLIHLVKAAAATEEMRNPLQVLQFIQNYQISESVPNLVIVIRIFLTRAISVASCERSFSKLKLIKNHLRNTMSQSRLTSLAILSIERQLAEEIDFDESINEFAEKKSRKINF